MRDKARIRPFMERLTQLWEEEVSDWRFAQLISNIESFIGRDIFYIEDDEMSDIIEQFFKKK